MGKCSNGRECPSDSCDVDPGGVRRERCSECVADVVVAQQRKGRALDEHVVSEHQPILVSIEPRIGLILEVVPDDELQDRAMALATRMARVPTNQLVMLKLLCNQTVENMGFASSRVLGSLFDGIARHTQEGLDFVGRAQEVGFRQAVRERDDPFGDYGSRHRK